MRSFTVRLPEQLVTEIEEESRARKCPKSDVVRDRLRRGASPAPDGAAKLNIIADLIGSVDDLPSDLSANAKSHLKATGYGKQVIPSIGPR